MDIRDAVLAEALRRELDLISGQLSQGNYGAEEEIAERSKRRQNPHIKEELDKLLEEAQSGPMFPGPSHGLPASGVEQVFYRAAAEALPFLRKRIRPESLPKEGSFADTVGQALGNLALLYPASRALSAGSRVLSFAPRLARAAQRAHPLVREFGRDVALSPLFHGVRKAVGHEVRGKDVARDMLLFAGAGAAAAPAQQLALARAPRAVRPITGAAAAAGGLAATLPLQEGETTRTKLQQGLPDALMVGLATGALYPVGTQRAHPQTEAPSPASQDAPAPITSADRGALAPDAQTVAPLEANLTKAEILRGDDMNAIMELISKGDVPELFLDAHQIRRGTSSLPRAELNALPKPLRDNLRKIDRELREANDELRALMKKHKASSPSELPEELRERAQDLLERISDLGGQREGVKTEVIVALEARGKLGQLLLDRMDKEAAQEVVEVIIPEGPRRVRDPGPRPGERPVTEREIAGRLDPEELGLSGPIQVGDPEGVAVYVSEFSTNPGEDVLRFVRSPTPEVSDAMATARTETGISWFDHLTMVIPRRVLGEDVMSTIRDADRRMTLFVRSYEKVIEKALKPFARNPEARMRISQALEGTGEVANELEARAVKILREEFFGSGPDSGLFKEFGINPDQFLTNYLPRIRRAEDLGPIARDLPPEYKSFFAEMSRVAEDWAPREMDALNLATAYLRAGAKKKFVSPVLDELRPVVAELHPDRQEVYQNVVNHVLGRPILEERFANEAVKQVAKVFGVELKGRPAKDLSHIVTELVYQNLIGFNLHSVMKNLTQTTLTIGELGGASGVKWVAKAYQARRTPSGKALLEHSWVWQNRDFLEGLRLEQSLFDRVMGPFRKKSFAAYQWADTVNVQTSFLAGAMKALDEGRTLKDAIAFGNEVAAKTQFLYGIDGPLRFKGPVGRAAGMLFSWPLNFMAGVYDNLSAGERGKVASTITAMLLAQYGMSKATGLDFSSIGPVANVQGHPIASALEGDFSPPIKLALSGYRYALEAVRGDDYEELERAKEQFNNSLKTFIPVLGNAQVRRISKFVERATNDWKDLDSQGRTRAEVSPGEAFRAVFGTTVESSHRWEARDRYQSLVQNVAEGRITREQALRDLSHLEKQSRRAGLDLHEVQQQAIARARSLYYGRRSRGLWPGLYRGEDVSQYVEALKRLGVTAENVHQSGKSRGIDEKLIAQAVELFGGLPPKKRSKQEEKLLRSLEAGYRYHLRQRQESP